MMPGFGRITEITMGPSTLAHSPSHPYSGGIILHTFVTYSAQIIVSMHLVSLVTQSWWTLLGPRHCDGEFDPLIAINAARLLL